jgi:hypothetical protein
MHAQRSLLPLAPLFGAAITSAFLLTAAPAFAQGISPSSDAGAATAGLIRFYGERCRGERGYSLTAQARAFVNNAANARPAIFRAGYTSEAHMPTQNCAGAYENNFGPGGVGSKAVGFTIMRSGAR